MNRFIMPLCHCFLLVMVGLSPDLQAVNTWKGGAGGDWFASGNWSASTVPADGDDVAITNSSVLLTNATAKLASLTLTNATLLITNFVGTATNIIYANNVLVNKSGLITNNCFNTDTNGGDGWQIDACVWIVCSNLTVNTGGVIAANLAGYRGGHDLGGTVIGSGPGGGSGGAVASASGAGGGYGGIGGSAPYIINGNLSSMATGGVTYGSASAPLMPGSGGGNINQANVFGGYGGGLIMVNAAGLVQVNGTISAVGGTGINHGGCGAGSGGGINIACNQFRGTGTITADGGPGNTGAAGAAGGGGRIAVVYDTTAQQSVTPKPTVTFSSWGYGWWRGAPGTVYFPDTNFYPMTYSTLAGGTPVIGDNSFTSWTPTNLTITGWYAFPTNFTLNVVSNLTTVGGFSGMMLTNSTLTVGGDLVVSNGSVSTFMNSSFSVTGAVRVIGVGTAGNIAMAAIYSPQTPISVGSITVNQGALSVNQASYGGVSGYLLTGGVFTPSNFSLTVGSVLLTNNGSLYLFAGQTNAANPDYGALMTVNGSMTVASGGTCYPYSSPTNGGSVKLLAVNGLTVASNGLINANASGFFGGYSHSSEGPQINGFGPGGGKFVSSSASAGGGYGGRGASNSPSISGSTYGLSNAPPFSAGSGGSGIDGNQSVGAYGGRGGGLIWIDTSNANVTIDGKLQAQGGLCVGHGGQACGSGGGIYIRCVQLYGAGSLNVDGGGLNTQGSPVGGGGRIAVWRANANTMTASANYGPPGYTNGSAVTSQTNGAGNGTIYWGTTVVPYPIVENRTPSSFTATSASLNGYLVSTGTSPTTVSVYWGPTDGGDPVLGLWQYTNSWPQDAWGNNSFLSTNVTPLPVPDQICYYRYGASNANASVAATSSVFFLGGTVSVTSSAPNASEAGLVPGTFAVYRASTATNEDIMAYFTIGGTASLGWDYNLSSTGSVMLKKGSASTNVVVTPLIDPNYGQGTLTVVLTLTQGLYAVGASASSTVYIADTPIPPAGINRTLAAGNWNDYTIWSRGNVPVDGDDVIMTNNITLNGPSHLLNSLTVSNATLLITNYVGTATNFLYATNVFVLNRGVITNTCNTDTNGADGWQMDSCIAIVCANLTVASNGLIIADQAGFHGGQGSSGGGATWSVNGCGPGGSPQATICGGAGYGGKGGAGNDGTPGGTNYGSAAAPLSPGSGGGVASGTAASQFGGNGGGLIWIPASGQVQIDGTISAVGGTWVNNGNSGGGSGGGIYITCNRFLGTGAIIANGGAGQGSGSGAGGRIAVIYDTTAQLSVSPKPTVTFNAWGYGPGRGEPGTLYFPDANFFPVNYNTLAGGMLVISNGAFTSWAPNSLTVTGWFAFPSGLTLNVASNLTSMGGYAGITLTNSTLTVGGDLVATNGAISTFFNSLMSVTGTVRVVGGGSSAMAAIYAPQVPLMIGNILVNQGKLSLNQGSFGGVNSYALTGGTLAPPNFSLTVNSILLTNNGSLYLFGGPTNASYPNYGSLLTVVSNMTVASGGTNYVYSSPTNGGSVKMVMLSDLAVASGGMINANGTGYKGGGAFMNTNGFGPGGGKVNLVNVGSGGGGYGGRGGAESNSATVGGVTYGSSNTPPFQPGSGGASYSGGEGGWGGGLVWIEALNGNLTVNGSIQAIGVPEIGHGMAGNGSGGCIYIRCKRLFGAGSLSANGGMSSSGGADRGGVGGGGRIAVWRVNTNTLSATADYGYSIGGSPLISTNGASAGTIYWGATPESGTILMLY